MSDTIMVMMIMGKGVRDSCFMSNWCRITFILPDPVYPLGREVSRGDGYDTVQQRMPSDLHVLLAVRVLSECLIIDGFVSRI